MLTRDKSKIQLIAVTAGGAVNLLLFFVKLYIGLSSNSIAIYADSLNSLLDFLVMMSATVGLMTARKAANEKYPFGYGKAEELINFFVSVTVVITGGIFIYMSLERFMYPVPVWYSQLYAVLTAVCAGIKLLLMLFFRTCAKKTGSQLLSSLSSDSILDFFITLCTLISFTLTAKIGFALDGAAGILIGIIIGADGIKSTLNTGGVLIGKRDERLCNEKAAEIMKNADIAEITDIQCHRYGEKCVITAVIKPGNSYTGSADALTHEIKKSLAEDKNTDYYIITEDNNEDNN